VVDVEVGVSGDLGADVAVDDLCDFIGVVSPFAVAFSALPDDLSLPGDRDRLDVVDDDERVRGVNSAMSSDDALDEEEEEDCRLLLVVAAFGASAGFAVPPFECGKGEVSTISN
jgi:hypothetical protein